MSAVTQRQKSTLRNLQAKEVRWQDVINGVNTGFEVCHVEGIGRGIRTTKSFKGGEYLLRYFGELITMEELDRREQRGPKRGCFYRFAFPLKKKWYALDATIEDNTFARLSNHSRKKPNMRPVAFDIDGTPSVVFVANFDLEPGVELRWDYGERRPEVIKDNPWLKE